MNRSINTAASKKSAIRGVHNRVHRKCCDIRANYAQVGRHRSTTGVPLMPAPGEYSST
jgi:hypothetical protein